MSDVKKGKKMDAASRSRGCKRRSLGYNGKSCGNGHPADLWRELEEGRIKRKGEALMVVKNTIAGVRCYECHNTL